MNPARRFVRVKQSYSLSALALVMLSAAGVGSLSVVAGYWWGLLAVAAILFLVAGLVLLVMDYRLLLITLMIVTIFFGEGFNPSAGDRFIIYRLGFAHVYVVEILTWLIVCSMLFQRRRQLQVRRHGTVIALLAALSVSMWLAGAHGWVSGADPQLAFGYDQWRAWFMATGLTAAIICACNRADIRLVLTWVATATAIHAVQGLIVFLLGGGDIHPTEGVRVPFFDSMEGSLFCLFSLYGFVRVVKSRDLVVRLLWTVGVGAMVASILLDYRRVYWLALITMVAAILIIRSFRRRTWLAFLPLLFVAIDVFPWTQSGLVLMLDAKAAIQAIVLPQSNDTTTFHILDLHDVGQTLVQSPISFIFGLGSGNGFVRELTLVGVGGADVTTQVAHSVYLTIWLRMGLVGVVIFCALLIVTLHRGLESSGSGSQIDQAVLTSGLLAFAATFVFGTDLFGNTRFPLLFGFLVAGIVVYSDARPKLDQNNPEFQDSRDIGAELPSVLTVGAPLIENLKRRRRMLIRSYVARHIDNEEAVAEYPA
jgi:hypothetical protein